MKGFFFNSREDKKRAPGQPRIATPRQARGPVVVPPEPSCHTCRLYEGCKSPKMKPGGLGKKRIMIVSDTPGEQDDGEGTHFIGKSGGILRDRLLDLGIDLNRDCIQLYSTNCRTPNGRVPTPKEVTACRPVFYNAVKEHKPHVIILLGNTPVDTAIEHRWAGKLEGIGTWRGFAIPDREFNAWVIPTFHPSFILRGQEGDMADSLFCDDLTLAVSCLNKPLPTFSDELKAIKVLETPEDAVHYLDELLFAEPELTAFDYETTGLKPYGENHRVICASICHKPDEVAVFAFPKEPHKELIEFWRLFLASKTIGKIASNLKFEHTWSLAKFGVEPVNWQWDTMLAAHVLDNRPGITSIKFQGYIYTGLIGYENEVKPYLKATPKDEKLAGGNAINQIEQAPLNRLLHYCALDSLLEYRVALLQMNQIHEATT